MSDQIVLNEGEFPEDVPEQDVAGRLRSDINRFKVEFYDLECGRVNYEALVNSPVYARYVQDTTLLKGYDLKWLGTREEKLAFWINIYNTLVIHGVIALKIHESVKEDPDFFKRICYDIGGVHYTPDDIEHGILRGNRRQPHGLFQPFDDSDPRLPFVIDPPDPRIHFALVCASSSCPPINYYTSERIDGQLEVAAAGFVNGPEVEILPRENLLRLSPIFNWYRPDFGGHEGVVDTLIRHLDHGEAKDFLMERGMAADVEWKEYDWRLNR